MANYTEHQLALLIHILRTSLPYFYAIICVVWIVITFQFRLMNNEGLLDILRKTRYYRKPYMQRNELSREISKAIINEDMRRKIQFLMRKNRPDPYPGQITT